MSPRRLVPACLALIAVQVAPPPALAFCGLYVGRADTALLNQSARIVLARHDGKTVITMVNDYQGALEEFAMVVPVPQAVEPGQIHITDRAVVDHLDAYTAPRLVEEFDADPCRARHPRPAAETGAAAAQAYAEPAAALGVEIEARQVVGEYDITILSAQTSARLADWLRREGYRLPDGAERTLRSYVADEMRFILARVDLSEQTKLGYSHLRPLQIAYESDQVALPIRLGMLNADGPQELIVLALTRDGRIEPSNYRRVRVPSDIELPLYVKQHGTRFYRDLFETQVAQADGPTVFLEYAWEVNLCEACTAEPMSFEELRELGVFWILDIGPPRRPEPPAAALAKEVFVTRLHLRYDAAHFPNDLHLRETDDRTRFQARYVLHHPWIGEARCEAAEDYVQSLPQRFEQEARTLAHFTGRPIDGIRERMAATGQPFDPAALEARQREWWQRLWQD